MTIFICEGITFCFKEEKWINKKSLSLFGLVSIFIDFRFIYRYMKKLWFIISFLGLDENSNSLKNKTIILSNRINFIMILLLILLNVSITVIREIESGIMTFGSLRILILLILNLILLFVSYFGYHTITKIYLVFIPNFIVILLPTLIGFVEQESFFYYSIVILAFSLIPQLLLIPQREKNIYIISMIYFLIQIALYDDFLMLFSKEKFIVNIIMNDFYTINKVINISAFIFIHTAIFYLRNLNYKFEKETIEYNKKLTTTIEELKTAQQNLVQSEKMASLGTLTAGIAHELNNPLNFISGGLHLVNDFKKSVKKESRHEINEAAGIIEEGLEQANSIVSSLMTFSYKGYPKLVKSDISDILDKTLLFLKSKINNNITIRKSYNIDIEVGVYQDKLHQVFLNIIDNAIFAVNLLEDQSEKKISIRSYTEIKGEENYAVIQISNNGPKIQYNYLNKIFDPFFTTKDPGVGTGLGLSICYSLIEDHNGYIDVYNNENDVKFAVFIPI